jgi:hypothetical protein
MSGHMTSDEVRKLSPVDRLKEIKSMLPEAKQLSDDGNWPEVYYDDVRFLLRMLARLQRVKA